MLKQIFIFVAGLLLGVAGTTFWFHCDTDCPCTQPESTPTADLGASPIQSQSAPLITEQLVEPTTNEESVESSTGESTVEEPPPAQTGRPPVQEPPHPESAVSHQVNTFVEARPPTRIIHQPPPPPPAPTEAEAAANELREAIRSGFRTVMPRFRYCYEALLQQEPDISDRLIVELSVHRDPDNEEMGIPELVSISTNELEIDDLECFANVVDLIEMPPPDSAADGEDDFYIVNYPIVLTADRPTADGQAE